MKFIFAGLLACLSITAFAQDNVLDLVRSLEMDFNNDGVKDTVSLSKKAVNEYHTLTIKLSGKNKKLVTVVSNSKLVNAISNPGAYLEKTSETSFVVGVDHTGIGRMAHVTTRAIAYRNSAFILSGFNLEFWDKIDHDLRRESINW